jgi:hypothetical protein
MDRQVAFAFVCFLGLAPVLAHPQKLVSGDETRTKAEELVSKSSEKTNIWAPGGTPFFLLANVHLQSGGKSVDGVYAVAWASPTRFRRAFRFPDFTRTEVVVDDTLYRKQSSEAVPLLVWELDKLLGFLDHPKLEPEAKVKDIKTAQAEGVEVTCLHLERLWGDSKVCLNAATNELVSADTGSNARRLERLREHYRFSDYRPFQQKSVPWRLSFHGWDSQTVEVQVDKLIAAQSFPSDEFAPPSESKKSGFCREPKFEGAVKPSTGNTIPIGMGDIEVDMYFEVTPIGGVRYAQVVYSTAPLLNKEVLNWFVGTHFPIETCAGTPINYQTIIRFVTGH